jgi:hypothetical protein
LGLRTNPYWTPMACGHSHAAALYGDMDEHMMQDNYNIDSDEEDEFGRFWHYSAAIWANLEAPGSTGQSTACSAQHYGVGQTPRFTQRDGLFPQSLRHRASQVRRYECGLPIAATGLAGLAQQHGFKTANHALQVVSETYLNEYDLNGLLAAMQSLVYFLAHKLVMDASSHFSGWLPSGSIPHLLRSRQITSRGRSQRRSTLRHGPPSSCLVDPHTLGPEHVHLMFTAERPRRLHVQDQQAGRCALQGACAYLRVPTGLHTTCTHKPANTDTCLHACISILARRFGGRRWARPHL